MATRNNAALCLLIVPVILLNLHACKAPGSREDFVRRDEAIDGNYKFSLDFEDSTDRFDLYLCTRIDGTAQELFEYGEMPIRISFISPKGNRYVETVHFPLTAADMSRARSFEFFSLYRSGMRQKGVWQLELRPMATQPLPEGLRGFGIQMTRQDGQR